MRSTLLSKLSVIICFFVCLFFFCKTNKLRAIWVGRLGTLAKKPWHWRLKLKLSFYMLTPDCTPLTIGIEKWKKKRKEWKERNFARLKYKNYYLKRRALLTADEFFSDVCAGHVNEDELQFDNFLFANSQRIKTPWKASFYHFLSKKKKRLGYFYWRRLSL